MRIMDLQFEEHVAHLISVWTLIPVAWSRSGKWAVPDSWYTKVYQQQLLAQSEGWLQAVVYRTGRLGCGFRVKMAQGSGTE